MNKETKTVGLSSTSELNQDINNQFSCETESLLNRRIERVSAGDLPLDVTVVVKGKL